MTRYLVSPTSSSIGIASFPGSRQLMKEGGVNTEVGPGVDLELAYVDPASSQAFQKLSYKENHIAPFPGSCLLMKEGVGMEGY